MTVSDPSEEFVALLEAFDASDWQEMSVQLGADRLHVSRRATDSVEARAGEASPSAPVVDDVTSAPPTAAAPPLAAPARPGGPNKASPLTAGVTVTSPSVGIYWRAPSPTEPPFVEVGQWVEADDTVGIVEVMKLMQQIPAGVAGTVIAVLVGNGETVEYGQSLVQVDPEGG